LELNIEAPIEEQDNYTETSIGDSFQNTDGYEPDSDDTSFISLPSLLEQHGADYEAEAFAKRKEAETKRRKRRGRRM